jgi:hypothetical protein
MLRLIKNEQFWGLEPAYLIFLIAESADQVPVPSKKLSLTIGV